MQLARKSATCFAIVVLIFPSLLWGWDTPAPASGKETAFVTGTIRAQVRYKDISPLFETNGRIEGFGQGNARPDGISNTTLAGANNFNQQPWYAMLGTYYNVFNFLMIGGFYRYGQGERHRNDWIGSGWGPAAASPTVWDWFWLNTNGRPEQSAIGDVTLRQKIPFLPDGLVFELKNRFMYTWYTDDRYAARDNWGASTANIAESRYIVRPGIQYFWMDGDRPFMTFFLQYEAHFALNFGSRNLVESWGYLGFMHNITENLSVGLNVARAQWWWTTSNSVAAVRPAENCSVTVGGPVNTACNQINYTATQLAWVYGITATLRFDLTPAE